MPVPIFTFGVIIVRASLRPINNLIMGHFKNAKNHPIGFQFFSQLGYGTHRIETMIKNAGKQDKKEKGDQVVHTDETENIEDEQISEEQAFNVGIDWFTEIVFFYGVLFAICWWEFKKFAASQKNINLRIKNLEDNSEKILELL